MKFKQNFYKLAELGVVLTGITILVLAGCSSGSGTGGGTAGSGAGNGTGTVTGVATLGNLHSATATAYDVDDHGVRGASLGSATTDSSGRFSISLSSIPSGHVAVVITGGSYVSEADGSTQAGPASGVTALLSGVSSGAAGVAVSPLSDMAYAFALAHAAASGITTALPIADTFVRTTFGLSATATPETTIPDFSVSLSSDAGKTALIISALEGLATKLASGVPGLTRSSIYAALSTDMSRGTPGASAVSIASGVSLPTTTLGFDFAAALASVNTSLFTASGAASAVAAEAASIGSSVTAIIPKTVLTATGVSSSSSGAMSYTSIGGHQYLYIAARQKGVRKVDVTNPASPVEVVSPAWTGATLSTDTGFGTSPATIGGATVVSSSTGVKILAFAYGSKHIALLDPNTGSITFEGDLPIAATSPDSFSGGSAYIAGAIPDPGKGAWLATADGYIYLDINATLAAGTGAAPVIGATKFAAATPHSTPNALAENLGGDIAHNLLFTPNYSGLNLQIVPPGNTSTGGLATGIYLLDSVYQAASATVASGSMDGGSVDTGLGVGIISYEDTSNISFINLNGIAATAVPSSGTPGTFKPTASNGFVDVPIGGGTFSGTAVDSQTHQILGMAGYSTDIMVGQLQDPASVAAGAWTGMSDWVWFNLSTYLTGYADAQDPHANVTVYNTLTRKTYAYVLNGSTTPTGVVQMDVSGLLAMPHATAHQLSSSPTLTGGPVTQILLP